MPTISFEAPTSVTVSRRDGSSVTVEIEKLPANALAYLFSYGVKQAVADAASSAGGDTGEANKMLADKVAALYSGNIRIASERTGDPVLREALAIVMPKVRDKFKAAGHNVTNAKAEGYVSSATIREKALEFLGDRASPKSESAAKAWALAAKRVEEAAFDL